MNLLDLRTARTHSQLDNVERNALHEQLNQAKRENFLLRAAIESSSVGIVVTEPAFGNNAIVYSNPAFQKMSGYSEQELLGFNCRIVQGPKTSPESVQQLRDAIRDERTVSVTLLNYHRSGNTFWNQLTISPVRNDNNVVIAYVGIQKDVTAQKEAEDALLLAKKELEERVISRTAELQNLNVALVSEVQAEKKLALELKESREQLRALAARLDHVREEERARISREVHDELGQLLTHLKLEMGLIGHQVSNDFTQLTSEHLESKLTSMREEIDVAIQSVRRIASDLRPSILDKLGLYEAMSWLSQDFQSRAGVRCSFECTLDESFLGDDRAIVLFRIAQEALTNVSRHAAASRVSLKLYLRSNHIVFEVNDNGVGFSPSVPTISLGILGMSERVAQIGGVFSVVPLKRYALHNKGTKIVVRIPLDRRKNAAPE